VNDCHLGYVTKSLKETLLQPHERIFIFILQNVIVPHPALLFWQIFAPWRQKVFRIFGIFFLGCAFDKCSQKFTKICQTFVITKLKMKTLPKVTLLFKEQATNMMPTTIDT